MVAQVGYSMTEWSGGQVMLCAVCTVHVETRNTGFLVEPQNQGRRFISGLASKPLRRFVSGLASKPLGRFVSGLALKSVVMVFSGLASKPMTTFLSGLASKPVAMISPGLTSKLMVDFLVEPQNQCGGGFTDLSLKIDNYDLVICVLKSPQWFLDLGLKTKQATVCQLRHKTDGRAMVWDMRRDLTGCFT
jgi:hypothetical protein